MRYYPHFILAMRSSRGFASAAPDCFALLRLAFATASCQRQLTSPVTASRRIIMQKAHHQASPGRNQNPRQSKSEIRISKSETNPKSQIRMTKTGEHPVVVSSFVVRISNLLRISKFVFRICRLDVDSTLARRPLIACRHVVSGSLSSPDRGSSHLSLALLGPLSVAREYLALGDGPPGFGLTFTC
jgi:hypothetical protein